MKLTIIVADNTVGIDGEFRKIDLSSLDPTFSAIQWDGAKGHIEFLDDKPNLKIISIAPFSSVISAWSVPVQPPAPPTEEQLKEIANEAIKQKIDGIERNSLRAIREAILTNDKTVLIAIEAEIVAEREKLTTTNKAK